jgi:hypothetical protein
LALPRRAAAAVALAAAVCAAGTFLAWRLRRDVRGALEPPVEDVRPLQLVPLERPAPALETWCGPEVEAVAFPGGELLTAGAAGVRHARRGDLTPGLPSRRATALALWAGEPVVALEAGGVAVLRGGAWHELRSGWGELHARALVEAPGGELLVGAREGLFRAPVAATRLERLDTRPVRAIAVGPGFVLAGGEQGLLRIAPGRATPVATPDPWIEAVVLDGDALVVATAAGLARGPRDGALAPVRGAETARHAVAHAGRVYAATEPPTDAVLVTDGDGNARVEGLPSAVRRVMTGSGLLFADAEDGLHRRDADGWRLVVPRRGALPAGSAHVTALARFRDRLVAGFFDGGVAVAQETGAALDWRRIEGTAAWGTNALLSSGGELWVASLRGAARYDGRRMRPIDGPGAAFSLAATRSGVAIGYGQGVLLPGGTLLSAFHGLPGNQALALAERDVLYVGTPSGIGALDGRRVLWRVTAGEGKLPHPWVTAIVAEDEGGLLVGTWGGGIVRRRRPGGRPAEPRSRADAGRWEPFAETEGLAVSPGALAVVDGRAWAGTDAAGLWRETRDRARFERVRAALPSARVTALLAEPGTLWVGTDQGLVRLPVATGNE